MPILLGCALLLRLGTRHRRAEPGRGHRASLGVPVTRTLRLAAAGTALAVGAGAAVAGSIGFVGLVVPHLLRPWLGERPGALLPAAPLAGAALLLVGRHAGAAGAAGFAAVGRTADRRADRAAWRAVPGRDRAQGRAVIGLSHKSVALGGRTVLHDMSFPPAPGELVALCGPNGAGKSTLLRALAGLLPGTARRDPRRVA